MEFQRLGFSNPLIEKIYQIDVVTVSQVLFKLSQISQIDLDWDASSQIVAN